MPTDLRSLYSVLGAPGMGGLTFTATSVPGWAGARVARTASGPALLLEVPSGAEHGPNIELKNLRVLFASPCRVTDEHGTRELELTAIVCNAPDDAARWLFFEVIEAALADRPALSNHEIATTIKTLVEVFRSLSHEPKSSVIGVWGELYMIARSADPDVVVRSWHSMPGDRYDFACAEVRVEVKTTTGQRRHRFSLEQLRPVEPFDVVIASIVTHSSAAGFSVGELIRLIGSRLQDKTLVVDVTASVAQALGSDSLVWGMSRYDAMAADSSIRFLSAIALPCVQGVPAHVFDVQLSVDVDAANPVETAIEDHGLLGVAMARVGE